MCQGKQSLCFHISHTLESVKGENKDDTSGGNKCYEGREQGRGPIVTQAS